MTRGAEEQDTERFGDCNETHTLMMGDSYEVPEAVALRYDMNVVWRVAAREMKTRARWTGKGVAIVVGRCSEIDVWVSEKWPRKQLARIDNESAGDVKCCFADNRRGSMVGEIG